MEAYIFNTIEIESGIEIPKNGAGSPNKYPFKDMKIGDSFCIDGTIKNALNTVLSASRQYKKKFNPTAKFISRKVEDNKIRIWRIE